MTLVVSDRVQETCAAPGTGVVTLLGAATGYKSFSAGIGANNTTFYAIADQGGSNWEVGLGTIGATGLTLTRTTVFSSSNAGSLVNFSVGIQNIWCDYPAKYAVLTGLGNSEFVSGTAMLFVQSTAPIGWTKVTTYNDYALRIVSGTAGSGGSVAFSAAFSNGNVGSTTLSTSQIPNHYHSVLSSGFAGTLGIQVTQGGADGSWYGYLDTSEGTHYSDPTGNGQSSTFANNDNNGGGSHTHSLNIAVNYVDAIICTKN